MWILSHYQSMCKLSNCAKRTCSLKISAFEENLLNAQWKKEFICAVKDKQEQILDKFDQEHITFNLRC